MNFSWLNLTTVTNFKMVKSQIRYLCMTPFTSETNLAGCTSVTDEETTL